MEIIFSSSLKDSNFVNVEMTFDNRGLLEHLNQRVMCKVKSL
jgi:hypothetical protein